MNNLKCSTLLRRKIQTGNKTLHASTIARCYIQQWRNKNCNLLKILFVGYNWKCWLNFYIYLYFYKYALYNTNTIFEVILILILHCCLYFICQRKIAKLRTFLQLYLNTFGSKLKVVCNSLTHNIYCMRSFWKLGICTKILRFCF